MQSDNQKYAVIEQFANKVVPRVFPDLAATDHNTEYFLAILQANWDKDFSVEFLEQCIRQFRNKFEWLASNAPESSKKVFGTARERLALAGVQTTDKVSHYGEREQREREAAEKKRVFESNDENLHQARREAEDLADSFVGSNHSDTAYFRGLLNQTFAHRNTPQGKIVDWFETTKLRRDLIDKKTSGWSQ